MMHPLNGNPFLGFGCNPPRVPIHSFPVQSQSNFQFQFPNYIPQPMMNSIPNFHFLNGPTTSGLIHPPKSAINAGYNLGGNHLSNFRIGNNQLKNRSQRLDELYELAITRTADTIARYEQRYSPQKAISPSNSKVELNIPVSITNENLDTSNIASINPHNLNESLKSWKHYRGLISNNTFHGFGSVTFANGDSFDGFFDNGEVTGEGIYIFANGDRLVGTWRSNILDSNENIDEEICEQNIDSKE